MSLKDFRSRTPKGFSFSQSSLQDYTDCPRRFQLRYLEKLNWPSIETEPALENERRQIEGQNFHRLIHQSLLGVPLESVSRLANSRDLKHWWQNFQSTELGIDGYTKYPELILSAPLGEYRLLAKYDLIAIKSGQKALIFDWKTYAKRPKDEWLVSRWQTRIYRAILAEAGAHLNNNNPIEPEQIEMIYWFAEFPSEPARFTYDTQQFKRDWSVIEKLITEISSNEEFPMTEDENTCRFCAYRSYCERGIAAGIINEAGSESDLDTSFDLNFEQIGEIEL